MRQSAKAEIKLPARPLTRGKGRDIHRRVDYRRLTPPVLADAPGHSARIGHEMVHPKGAGQIDLLARSKALLFPGEEDFGIVPLEAAASGTPVLAYGRGGATETVCDGVTGLFFTEQSVEAVEAAILEFERRERDFDPQLLRRHAESFGEERFRQEFARQVELARTAQSRPPEIQ